MEIKEDIAIKLHKIGRREGRKEGRKKERNKQTNKEEHVKIYAFRSPSCLMALLQ